MWLRGFPKNSRRVQKQGVLGASGAFKGVLSEDFSSLSRAFRQVLLTFQWNKGDSEESQESLKAATRGCRAFQGMSESFRGCRERFQGVTGVRRGR